MKLYLFESDKIRDQKNNVENNNVITGIAKPKKEMGLVAKVLNIVFSLLFICGYTYGLLTKIIELSLGVFIILTILFGACLYSSYIKSIMKNEEISQVLKKELVGFLGVLIFIPVFLSQGGLFLVFVLGIIFWFILVGAIVDAVRKKTWKMLYPLVIMLFFMPISIYTLIALKNYPIIPINPAEVNALKDFSTYQIAYSRLMLKESGGGERYLRVTNLDKTSNTDNFKNLPDTVKPFFNETHSDINYNSNLSGFQVHMFPDRKLPLKPFNKIFKLPSFFVDEQGIIFIEWVSDRKKRNPAKQKIYHKISESEIASMKIIIK